jgi:hypothetical protein
MMATSKGSRQAFYAEARKQLEILKSRPKLKRKHLSPMLCDLFEGMLLILEEREAGDVKVSTQAQKSAANN